VTLYADFVNSDTYEESRPFDYYDIKSAGWAGMFPGSVHIRRSRMIGYFSLSTFLYIDAHSYRDL
jgi:hypothetical protein